MALEGSLAGGWIREEEPARRKLPRILKKEEKVLPKKTGSVTLGIVALMQPAFAMSARASTVMGRTLVKRFPRREGSPAPDESGAGNDVDRQLKRTHASFAWLWHGRIEACLRGEAEASTRCI